MSDFDRLAWICSGIAPAAWLVAAAGFLLGLLAHRQGAAGSGLQSALPAIVLAVALSGLLAHTVLALHVSRSRRFSSAERNALFRALWLGFGYQLWRRTMRAPHGRHQ